MRPQEVTKEEVLFCFAGLKLNHACKILFELVNLPSMKAERWGGLGEQKFILEVERVCLLAAITPAC